MFDGKYLGIALKLISYSTKKNPIFSIVLHCRAVKAQRICERFCMLSHTFRTKEKDFRQNKTDQIKATHKSIRTLCDLFFSSFCLIRLNLKSFSIVLNMCENTSITLYDFWPPNFRISIQFANMRSIKVNNSISYFSLIF